VAKAIYKTARKLYDEVYQNDKTQGAAHKDKGEWLER
jgi:hypothetical protein